MPIDLQAEREREVVDQISLVFEHAGLPPIAGRILGYLLICDPPHQSSADLAEYLNASRGAVSTTTRTLIGAGMVEKVRFRGDRSSYFRIRDGCWSELIHLEVVRIRRLRELADKGLGVLQQAAPERTRRLREFRDFNAFFEKEFPALVQLWDARSKS